MVRKTRRSVLLALALLAGSVGLTAAQMVDVTELTMRATPRGEAQTTFPTGTTVLYAGFHYEDVANDLIIVDVLVPNGGVEVFNHRDTYSGTGDAQVEITGADVYRELALKLVEAANQTRGDVNDLVNATQTVRSRVGGLRTPLAQVRSALGAIAILEPTGWRGDQYEALDEATDEIDALIQDALRLDWSDDEGMLAKAQEMVGPADRLVDLAEALDDDAGSVDSMELPAFGTDERSAYTLQVRSELGAIDDLEFFIGEADAAAASTATPSPRSTAPRDATTEPTARSGADPTARTAGTEAAKDEGAGRSTDTTGGTVSGATGSGTRPTATRRVITALPPAEGSAAPVGAPTEPAAGAESGPPTEAEAGGDRATAAAAAGQVEDEAPAGAPTWTVPPPGGGEESGSGVVGSLTTPSGSNRVVLGIGFAILAAMAIWLRKRM